jgi:polyvinyl alcohol dehydrogenase (cytochrome)
MYNAHCTQAEREPRIFTLAPLPGTSMTSSISPRPLLARIAVSFSLCGLIACSSSSQPPVTPGAGTGGVVTPPGAPVSAAGSAAPAGPTAAVGGPTVGTAGSAPSAAGGAAAVPSSGVPQVPAAGAAGSGAPIDGGDVPTSPGSAGANEWTMMGYDLASTYFNTAETKLTKENAASLVEAYTVDMGGNVYGAPLQVGDVIYASGPTIRALKADNGEEIWRAMVGTSGSLAYADGMLYLNGSGGRITALDAKSGMRLWQMPTDRQSADGSSSPLVVGDLLFIGGSNGGTELAGGAFRGYLSALDRKTGSIKWTTYTVPEGAKGASIWSSPSADLAAGQVYASTGNNYGAPATDTSDAFIAFDMMTGEIKWKYQSIKNDTFGGLGGQGPDADFGANPVLYEAMIDGVATKLIAAGNKGGEAHAARRDTGAMVWKRMLCMGYADGSRGVFVNSTWSGKNLLVACNEGGPATLYGLDGATGNISWMRKLDAQVWGRMSVANGVGFAGVGTTLEVFDVDSGAVLKTFPSKGGTVAGTISIANGRVAFGEGLTWSNGKRGNTLHVLTVK